ncbi:PAS domain S-box protein [bacterium]|nr:PAS domain S-box protein [bacterium]
MNDQGKTKAQLIQEIQNLRTELNRLKKKKSYREMEKSRNAALNLLEDLKQEVEERKYIEQRLRESEQRLSLALECTGVGLWDQDFRNNKVYRSDGWAKMLGYSPEEIKDDWIFWKSIVHPDDWAMVKGVTEAHESSQCDTFNVEHRMKTKSGHYKWIRNWGKVIERDENGKPLRALGLHVDIDARKQTEEELRRSEQAARESENRNRMLLDYAGVGIGYWDINGNLLMFNPQAARNMNGKSENLCGMNIKDLFEEKEASIYLSRIKKVAKSDRPMIYEDRSLLSSGEKWFLSQYNRVLDDQGKVTGIMIIASDITDKKRMEIALAENEQKYRRLFNSANDIIFIHQYTDERVPEHFIEVNDCAVRTLGYTRNELLNRTPMDIISQDDKKRVERESDIIFKKSESLFERIFITNKGNPIPFECHTRLFDYKGRPTALSICRNISERRRTEQALLAEQNLLRKIMDTSPVGITLVNAKGKITFANQCAEKLFKLSKKELTSRTYNDKTFNIRDPEGRPFPDEKLPFCIVKNTQKSVSDVRHAIIGPKGVRRLLSVNAEPLINEQNRFDGMVAVIEDITERMEADRALRESENKFRMLFENTSSMIILHDMNGRFLDANQRALDAWGYTKREFLKMRVSDMDPDSVRRDDPENLWKQLDQKANVRFESEIRGKNGSHCPIEIMLSKLSLHGQKVIMAVCRDITEQKKSEKEIQEHRKTLQYLSGQLIKTQEEERKRLSRELHDEMGQALTAIKLNIATLQKSLAGSKSEQFTRLLNETDHLTQNLMDDMHRLALELRPSILDDLGLTPALKWYTKQFAKRYDIKVSLQIQAMERRLPVEHETILYRIIQEALTNIAKYANASRVTIRLQHSDKAVYASILDNGRGFDMKAFEARGPDQRGIGLVGMHERVAAVNGVVNIRSRLEKGTTVKIVLPLR